MSGGYTDSSGSDVTGTPFPSPPPELVPPKSDVTKTHAPAIVVLETARDGLLRIKVESDVMAYILYCHYEEFAEIQQNYHVSISWSGADNSVIFCSTLRTDKDKLHGAAQLFVELYYSIIVNLVAVPLSSHVTNVTLQQYHRGIYEVKRFHPKAMVKEMGRAGRLVLYCPVEEVKNAQRTFLSALCAGASPSVERKHNPHRPNKKDSSGRRNRTMERNHANIPEPDFRTLPSKPERFRTEETWSELARAPRRRTRTPMRYYKDRSDVTIPPRVDVTMARHPAQRPRSFDKRSSGEFETTKRDHSRGTSPRRESDETISTNSSSGYGSTADTSLYRHHDTTVPPYIQGSHHSTLTKHHLLPPLPQYDSLVYLQPGQRHTPPRRLSPSLRHHSPSLRHRSPSMRHHSPSLRRGDAAYDDTDNDPLFMDDYRTPAHRGYAYPDYYATVGSRPARFVNGGDERSLPTMTPSPLRPTTGPLHQFSPDDRTYIWSPTTRGRSLNQFPKPSFIPKLKSPFHFKQNHKLYFETTTPTGIHIEIHEGDVTDTECDVIVNETNNQLHVTGELAWAVAKHGAFEIPKLTKLHVAMHGPISDSKVIVTPSVGLPSQHIIHAVTPSWHAQDQKKSRKQLYNTYKNIFNMANVDLKAASIALPVIGIASRKSDSYPFHVATEIMYQALVAFLKLGSPTLRQIRYVSNEPDQVNLIVTSIKPKLENVSYDARYLRQQRNVTKKLNNPKAAIR